MLLTNMFIISTFMIIVFTALYLSTYTEIENRTTIDLQRQNEIITFQPNPNPIQDFSHQIGFSVIVNDTSIQTLSSFEFTPNYIETLYELTDQTKDKITYEDTTYKYLITKENDTTYITYINITKDVELLQNQLITYIVIYIISLIITFFISFILTEQNIKPIETSYYKQKEFIQNASHELKTPLTVINTNIDVLLSDTFLKGNKWVRYMKTEITRMNQLVGDLLYLAKTEENIKPKQTIFNASEMVNQIILGFDASLYEKKITLHNQVNQDINLSFHKNQFTQCIMILVDNAIKYTKENNEIFISLSLDHNKPVFRIKNTGIGLTKEEQTRIFERFYKTDKSRKNTNSNSYGLGLSILKAILDNHHATIKVDSDEQNYTEFTIKFK